MKNPYNAEQRRWLDKLQERHRSVFNGVCMASIRPADEHQADPCEGPIGNRHAIAKRHLRLIADADSLLRANKEVGSFAVWSQQYDNLQLVLIGRFSAGRWSCQKHDQRFQGIDAQRIDLSEPENLFKAIYRVVLRHNHLMMARWNALFLETETEEGWNRFKETAFNVPVSDDEAANAASEWRQVAQAVMAKMRVLETRLARSDWNSLDYRALLLASDPTVAGWGCLTMKFDLSALHPDDPRTHWNDHVDLGYIIVIPQQDGQAIITACEPDTRFRVPEIVRIHNYIPQRANPNEPHRADEHLRGRISRKLWNLNELGMRESLYQSWSATQQREVQLWMKSRGASQRPLSSLTPTHLPSLF